MAQPETLLFSIEIDKPNASFLFSRELYKILKELYNKKMQIVILCIGTDRSTGDCLGPLVGRKLNNFYVSKYAEIFGTLKEPVHAKNLDEKIDLIYETFNNPFVIAVDASLGRSENIGKINLYKGSLCPGAGVNKTLKNVGDISITGIVNISGFMEYMVLQNTRLSMVMDMADTISLSLYMSLKSLFQDTEFINKPLEYSL